MLVSLAVLGIAAMALIVAGGRLPVSTRSASSQSAGSPTGDRDHRMNGYRRRSNTSTTVIPLVRPGQPEFKNLAEASRLVGCSLPSTSEQFECGSERRVTVIVELCRGEDGTMQVGSDATTVVRGPRAGAVLLVRKDELPSPLLRARGTIGAERCCRSWGVRRGTPSQASSPGAGPW